MEAVKCFICDADCAANEKNLGTNIARILTMPMRGVIAKCLRTMVDTENEYFCNDCTSKIEEYDQVLQLTVQIETELYDLYQKKPCYLVEAEIVQVQGTIDQEVSELKMEDDTNSEFISPEELNASYDEMFVEYLEDDETALEQDASQKVQLRVEPKETAKNMQTRAKTTWQTSKAQTRTRNQARKKIEVVKCTEGIENTDKSDEKPQQLEENDTTSEEAPKQLVCDICGQSYKSKSALCVHLSMHNNKNAHECHLCGKTFTQRGALVRHMPMHTGERPHQCDVCGKRFIHYSSFHMHQMIHTNERKKKCTICGSEFRSNSHMTRHMRSHTGEKPFECPVCGQKFAQRYNMKTHYNTHQGIHRAQSKNYRCLICSEAFPRREKLNKHLRQAHLISDEDVTSIATHGPESEVTQKIIDRLKLNVYTKEEVLIEYIDEAEDMFSTNS